MNYQLTKLHDLSEDYSDYSIHTMHNGDEKSTISEQVETLTNGTLKYGHFKHGDGFLINEVTNTLIILPEKSLEERHLFEIAKEKLDLGTDKIEFIIKKSESDIDYLTRENNKKGFLEVNNKIFSVFDKKPSAQGDATTVYLVKQEDPEVVLKEKTQFKSKNKLKPS